MESPQTSPPFRALIIGAGAAGLQAASLLHDKGFEVIILEAKDYVGGRIKEERNFVDFPIELGGEEVHGEASPHYLYAKKAGAELVEEEELCIYAEVEGKLCHEDQLCDTYPEFTRVTKLDWEELGSYDQSKEDMTVADYVKESGFSDKFHFAIDGVIGREWGSDLEELSVRGISRWNSEWGFGEKNFLLRDMSNVEILKKEFCRVLDKVILNTPVMSISYGKDQDVVIRDKMGRIFMGDIVVIAVPVTQLKKGGIKFDPELPEKKIKALEQIKMDPAMKVFIKFKKRLWNEDMGVLITNGVIRLGWVSSTGGKSEKNHVLTSLITGRMAAQLSKLNREEQLQLIMAELKKTLGEQVEEELDGFLVQDWTKEEYIEGGYSYPSVREDRDTRKNLAEPIENRVFFAGECMSSRFSTISGAIESGFNAYKEICERFF